MRLRISGLRYTAMVYRFHDLRLKACGLGPRVNRLEVGVQGSGFGV